MDRREFISNTSKYDRILCLSTNFHDRLAGKGDPANVNIIYPNEKNRSSFKIEKVDESLGWNHQQGTMFYWNPSAPKSQFFLTIVIQKQEL